MSPVDEFDATVQAFGETAVAYIGKENIRSLSVVASRDTRDASVIIVPEDHTPETYDRIIEKMIEVRGFYFGDLFIDYQIADSDDVRAAGSSANAIYATA
ncbi:hypothetical protein [Brevibacterium senegalense]|uniref:hypothetical protein n=1 Tax=Brevibacterium senegalense TaxID=1033736 RepID=UPI0011C9ACD1|nr:hypothetical protein [Brevibacterium senegalense]